MLGSIFIRFLRYANVEKCFAQTTHLFLDSTFYSKCKNQFFFETRYKYESMLESSPIKSLRHANVKNCSAQNTHLFPDSIF